MSDRLLRAFALARGTIPQLREHPSVASIRVSVGPALPEDPGYFARKQVEMDIVARPSAAHGPATVDDGAGHAIDLVAFARDIARRADLPDLPGEWRIVRWSHRDPEPSRWSEPFAAWTVSWAVTL